MSRTIESLALLGAKCKPFVFDLSSDAAHISIRDQAVRGRLLARDLAALWPDPAAKAVLVVGAGFAGISAALTCAQAGMSVVVVETGAEPFALQARTTERYVGPFLYEWPAFGANNQRYPPAQSWKDESILSGIWGQHTTFAPMPADRLSFHARRRLAALLEDLPNLQVWVNVPKQEVRDFVRRFAMRMAWHDGSAAASEPWRALHLGTRTTWTRYRYLRTPRPGRFRTDAVILGGGLGEERTALDLPPGAPKTQEASGTAFWDDDGWLDASADDDVGVFGAGDGALQDALRALSGQPHPLRLLDAIRAQPRADRVLAAAEPELLAMEHEARLAATWSQIAVAAGAAAGGRAAVDARLDWQCAALAQRLALQPGVASAVLSALRPGEGRVVHVFREYGFTKAYLLNRFLLHLIHASTKAIGPPPGRVRYEMVPLARGVCGLDHGESHATPKRYEARCVGAHQTTYAPLWFDRIAVRFGPDRGQLPGRQMVGLSQEAIAERTSLGQVPLPCVAHPMP
jgi:hypothetical protein